MADITFEDACEVDRADLIEAFDITLADNICQRCVHANDCPAFDLVQKEFPSDSIKECKFYEEY